MGSSKKLLPRKSQREDGFVVIAALMVIFLVVSIVATVAAVTSADLKSSARARAVIKTRFVAESVSDSIFAAIAREKTNYIQEANSRFIVPSETDPTKRHPLYYSEFPDAGAPSFGSQWFHISDSGQLEHCTDVKWTCFVARMKLSGDRAVEGPLARSRVTLDVIARGGCRSDGGTPKNCVYRNFQQVLRTRAYVENVQISETEYSDVIPGRPVAYIPSDEIEGSISTNDDRIYYCGKITNVSKQKLKNETGIVDHTQGIDACEDTTSAISAIRGDDKFLPGQVNRSGANVNTPLAGNSVFAALAGKSGDSPYNTGPTTIELKPSKVNIGGNDYPYPSNGVIYVNGTVTISGKFSRGLSIYANGDVTIGSKGITYESTDGSKTFKGEDGGVPPTDDGVILGIATANNIILECRKVSGRCDDVNVVAVLDAPNGTVYNAEWDDSPVGTDNPDDFPRFTLYGSIISHDHPIFGSYYSSGDGKLEHGWAKTLKMDGRLIEQQPPYFFRTTQANVVRGSLDESPCDSSDVDNKKKKLCN